jgi:iron complex transport system ATP-binding protein
MDYHEPKQFKKLFLMDTASPLLKTVGLSIGYKNNRIVKTLAGPLELELYPGQLICLLGPNGAGKSTLIRTLAGIQMALSGSVSIGNKNLIKLKPQDRAKLLSMVLTERVRSGNLNVFSITALGRFPYTNWLGTLQSRDREVVQWAMQTTGTTHFAGRKFDELSDGEAQKVMLARALAQDTPVIILDEPTAHLDLPNRVSLMRLLHGLARETGKGILLSTHDLDLALQTADQIWLMNNQGALTKGAPEDLVLNGAFEAAFGKEGIRFDKSSGTFVIHTGSEKSIHVSGEGAPIFWTKRALLREGYSIAADAQDKSIQILEKENRVLWLYRNGNVKERHDTIASLLAALRKSTMGTSNNETTKQPQTNLTKYNQ